MKKTAITIFGVADQGKSETIKEIALKLEAAFPSLQKRVINEDGDITFILSGDGVKIGIESQGDPYSRLMGSLPMLAKEGCDIIVCASRTSGMTVDAVNKLHTEFHYEIIWTANYRSCHKNQQQLNQISANQIVELIKLVISEKL